MRSDLYENAGNIAFMPADLEEVLCGVIYTKTPETSHLCRLTQHNESVRIRQLMWSST